LWGGDLRRRFLSLAANMAALNSLTLPLALPVLLSHWERNEVKAGHSSSGSQTEFGNQRRIYSAAFVSAGYKPAGRTGWKPVFRIEFERESDIFLRRLA